MTLRRASRPAPSPLAPVLFAACLAAAAVLLLVAVPAAAQPAADGSRLVPDGALVDVGGVALPPIAEGVTPDGTALDEQRPRLLMDGEGGFIVFWFEAEKDPALPRLLARRFDAAGDPLWQEREYWDPADGVETVGGMDDVAMNAAGDFAIVWTDPEEPEKGVLVRLFDVCGEALGPVVEVGLGPAQPGTEVVGIDLASVALTDDRVAVVSWAQVLQETGETGPTFETAVIQRVAADGAFVEPFHRVVADQSIERLDVTAGPGGGYALAAEVPTEDPAANDVRYARFTAGGLPVPTPPVAPGLPGHPSEEDPAVSASAEGGFLLAFADSGGQGPDGADGSCSGVYARFSPIATTEVRVNPDPAGCQGAPQAASPGSGWSVAWYGADADPAFGTDGSERGLYVTTFGPAFQPGIDPVPAPIRVLPGATTSYDLAAGGGRAGVAAVLPDASGTPRVVVQRLAPAGSAACTDGGDDHLCLQGDRFRVDGDWRDPYNGGEGPAYARDVRQDSGALWFFREPNLELLVKVLDGRGVNNRWWVFYGALSTVEYWVTVTDLELGRQKVYHNPPFVQASVADTDAFEVVGTGGAGSAVAASATVATLPDAPAREMGVAGLAAVLAPAALDAAACDGQPALLCLHGGEFELAVDWRDPRTGNEGTATGVPITGDTGAFWFFDQDNLDLMVKVLDGRPVNGYWWVIYAGLTDVEYTLRVVHRLEGGGEEAVTYDNPPLRLNSGADTTAFDGD